MGDFVANNRVALSPGEPAEYLRKFAQVPATEKIFT
jgi:hypothetical protein